MIKQSDQTGVCAALPALIAALWVLPLIGLAQESSPPPLRVGFARNLFSDVNVSDAQAAIMAWSQTVADEQDVRVDPNAQLFDDTASIVEALKGGSVDAVSVRFPDYQEIEAQVATGPWFLTQTTGSVEEEYILLVHQDSGIESLEDLQGLTLGLTSSSRMCLARDWLDYLLCRAGYKEGEDAFFSDIQESTKVSGAVLPVFFRKADAALAMESSFTTMCELNPQLGRTLRVLAKSRPLVPAVMLFRQEYESQEKERIYAALNNLHQSPAGQQVLTIFLAEALVQVDEGPLNRTEAFLSEVLAQHASHVGQAERKQP